MCVCVCVCVCISPNLCPVSWWFIKYYLNNCPRYDTKPSDNKGLVLELWRIWNIPSSPLLPGTV